jgi:hypothetical protein
MAMIRGIIRKLFPSKFVREQIQDLNQIASLFEEPLSYPPGIGFLTSRSCYKDIKVRLTRQLLKAQETVQKAREHESWISVRAYNLCAIVHMSYDDLA